MRRLNHKTGKPFERGDLRHDGKRFSGYNTKDVKKDGYYKENWVDAETANLTVLLSDCRKTAKAKNLPFDLDIEYLRSIKVDCCPIFKTPFQWDRYGEGYNTNYVPSLDKFYPELGYVKGNVAFISGKANRIKSDATEKEMYMVADWFWEEKKKRDAKKNAATSVSTGTYQEGEIYPELGTILATRLGKDDDNPHHHCGADARQDVDNCPQESSGDSVGHRGKEVGTPQTPTRLKDYGLADAEIIRLDFGRRHLSD